VSREKARKRAIRIQALIKATTILPVPVLTRFWSENGCTPLMAMLQKCPSLILAKKNLPDLLVLSSNAE
jgi:hypothetical protein